MVDIGGLSIKIEVDTREIDEAEMKIETVDQRIKTTWQKLKELTGGSIQAVGFVSTIVAQTLNVSVTIFEMIMGQSSPILNFILQMATAAVTIIYAIASAMASTGYGAYLAAGLVIVGTTLQVVATAYIQSQQETMSIRMSQMSTLFSQMSQLFRW